MPAGRRIVYGVQAVRLAIARGMAERLYLEDGADIRRLARLGDATATLPLTRCAAQELERLTGSSKHQGVAALVTGPAALSEREARDHLAGLASPLVLVLDGIEDPRNFGALLRTADAAGVDLVVSGRSRNVGITPVVSKVAAGAAEAQALAEVGNLARFLAQMSDLGIRLIGTDEHGDVSLFETDLTGPVAIVVGAEGQGLRRLTRERCDLLVSLPMNGVVESLNVAVAAGVCLYECLRQRSCLAPPGGVR